MGLAPVRSLAPTPYHREKNAFRMDRARPCPQGGGKHVVTRPVSPRTRFSDCRDRAFPVGSNGPVVVNFNPAINGLDGCMNADREVARGIIQNPSGFYVNVRTTEFPGGAVRGQLSR
jgi:hypothetical protein